MKCQSKNYVDLSGFGLHPMLYNVFRYSIDKIPKWFVKNDDQTINKGDYVILKNNSVVAINPEEFQNKYIMVDS